MPIGFCFHLKTKDREGGGLQPVFREIFHYGHQNGGDLWNFSGSRLFYLMLLGPNASLSERIRKAEL